MNSGRSEWIGKYRWRHGTWWLIFDMSHEWWRHACFGDIYRKSVRQFDRFVDMALNMAISNFEDLNRKKSNWDPIIGVKRLFGVIWDQTTTRVNWGHPMSFTRKKPCSVDRFATGICQTNFWTSRMTLTQFRNIANLKNMVRTSNTAPHDSKKRPDCFTVEKKQIYILWLASLHRWHFGVGDSKVPSGHAGASSIPTRRILFTKYFFI